jgi:hypothetical protein
MLRTIVALVSAPVLLAVASKKKVIQKSADLSARRPAQKQRTAKSKGKHPAAAAVKKKAPPTSAEAPVNQESPSPPAPKPLAPVQAPALFSPRAGVAAESLTPSFRWFYVGAASHYELVWSLDTHFHKAHILFTNQTAASLPSEQALEPGATYVWRVRGGNEGGWGPWSVTRTFSTPED